MTPASLPICSIIIPSYQSGATIGACLAALQQQDFARPYEIIVVDSSPGGLAERLRREFPAVRVIHRAQRLTPGQARNLGAMCARAPYLAFIDADCLAPAGWLRQLVAALEAGCDGAGGAIANGNAALAPRGSDTSPAPGANATPSRPRAAAPAKVQADEASLVAWAGYLCEFREFLPGARPARPTHNLTLGNAAYRGKAFWEAGGIPADFFPQEDQVFHHGFRARGYTLRLDPGIVVRHIHRDERSAFLQHQRLIGRSNARVVRRLNLRGVALLRRPWLARLALPALVVFRFARTVLTGLPVERGLVVRRPELARLCWQGMWAWGRGFVEEAG